MSITDVVFWVFILGGFGGAGEWCRSMLSDRRKHKLRKLELEAKKRKELEEANRPPDPICGCEHHLAKHGADGCHADVMAAVTWDAKKKPTSYERRRCNCQRYVGPEPLSQVYAPELF